MLGISFDTVEENRAFAEENDFPFRLLSDADRKVGEAYGAKRPDDHEWAAVPRRLTFLIDPEGKIAKTYVVKEIAAHPEELLHDLEVLTGGD